jgi:hypothetical protein
MATLSQIPDEVDLSFVAGDTFRVRVRVIDPNTSEPLPLDQYLFCAEIAKDPERSIVAEFDVTPDPAAPTVAVILTLPPSETAVLPGMGDGDVFKGMWDLEVKFPNNDIRTVAKGSVMCYIDVSHCEYPATGAFAGTPGTWDPPGATPPASVAALQSASPAIAPLPTTATWGAGQYIQTGTAGGVGEAHWDGTAWVAGRKP